jgi:hypothetical protein
MIQAFTPDPSQRLDLYFRVNSNGVPISFTFLDSAGDPFSFIYDDFQVKIKKYVGDKKNAILMGFGTGLSLTDNVLTLTFTETMTKVEPGEYYWELYKNDYGRPWLTGVAYAIDGNLPTIEATTTITVNEGGYDITITISEAGSSSVAWGDITGTLSNQTDLQSALDAKQATLVSGTNIKTINSTSLLGSGNITITSTSQFRGAHDASGNTFPAAGSGSGTAGAIVAGDEYYLSVAGTLDGGLWPIGTLVKALVDTPGQTTTNWRLS